MKDVTRTTPSNCKFCLHPVDAHTGAFENNIKPKEGDFSVCFNCRHISKFDEHLNLISLTQKEIYDLLESDYDVYIELKKNSETILSIKGK